MRYLLVILLYPLQLFAQSGTDEQKIQHVITRLFDGLAELDSVKTGSTTTNDFLLLEDGLTWSNDSLNKIIRNRIRSGKKIKRENTISFIRTTIRGNTAWTSFHNQADFTMDTLHQRVRWLESAVLVKQKKEWKIQLFHSTVVKREMIAHKQE